MMVCREHDNCIVVFEGFRCPICRLIEDKDDEIKECERALDEYEEEERASNQR